MPAPETGRFPPSREWKWGEANGRKKNLPFRRKPESHSRDSENFSRSGTLHCSPSANAAVAAEIPAFAGMEERAGMGILFLTKKEFLPSAACGGGCEREAVAGGGEFPMIAGIPPPPKNSLARIFTPPPQAAGGETHAPSIDATKATINS